MVTKTDINVITTVFRECVETAEYHPPLERQARLTMATMLAEELARRFEVQNARFDRRRFLEACNVV